MKKNILLLAIIILLTSCGSNRVNSENIQAIDEIYNKKFDGKYNEIPRENYDLSNDLLDKLNDDEIAYAFFNYPFLMDIKLSSNNSSFPGRLENLNIINTLMNKKDPLYLLFSYYKDNFDNFKVGDKEYNKKMDMLLILSIIKDYKGISSKANEKVINALEEKINNEFN